MNETEVRARLRQATRRAVRRHAAVQVVVEGLIEKPPAPGDVFVFDRTAAFDVEWAVIACDPADARRLLVVPADGYSLVGSTDVEVSESAPSGPLILRCRFGRWLLAAALDPRMRIGVLAPEDVARARLKWREVERGHVRGSPREREVDVDPDYRDWVEEVLTPARQALAGSDES